MINFFVKQLEIQQTIKITIKRKYANLSIKNGDLNRWAVGLVAASFGLHKVVHIFSGSVSEQKYLKSIHRGENSFISSKFYVIYASQ